MKQAPDVVIKEDIDSVMNKICDTFHNAAKISFGTRNNNKSKGENKSKPWFNESCKTARRKFHLAKKIHNKYKSDETKASLRVKSKEYKTTLDRCIKDYKANLSQKLKNLRSKNGRDFWKILNQSDQVSKCSVNIDDMYHFLRSMNETERTDSYNMEQPNFECEETSCEILDSTITEEEILSAVKKLKNNKSPGCDQVLNEHIVSTIVTCIFLPLYVMLFNIIYDTGIVPDEWLIGIVKPVYKNKGDPTQPENYRPITLLSCLGKLFTSVLSSRLEMYSDDLNLISGCQSGFRKGYSTLDNIILLHFLSHTLMHCKKKLFCAFIDFKQAFDTVWREGLWFKILKMV